MGLGVLKRKIILKIFLKMLVCLCCFCLVFVGMPAASAWAGESLYPLVYGERPETEEPVLELWETEGEYTVRSGDCLWDIAEYLWGDGKMYGELLKENQDIIFHPDLIYPGMTLKTSRKGYIVRKEAGHGGIQMGEYSMDQPGGWTVGVISSGEASANYVLSGNGIKSIACLIQDKRRETVRDTADWEKTTEEIRNFAKENYPDSVSDLSFEHYRMKNEEEVYLYSFTYRAGLEDYQMSGEFTCRVCVGIKLTGHIQAQFVGYAVDYDIESCVRYVTASFEEHTEGCDLDEFTVDDSNMAISPQTPWIMDGMFNSFAWIDEFFTALIERAAGIEPEKSPKESMLDRMTRTGK